MRLFRREGTAITAELSHQEAMVLAAFLAHLRGIVLGEGPREVDGVDLLARVFPKASRDDPAVAADFAAMTQEGLKQDKAARLGRLADRLLSRQVALSFDEAREATQALADARLITAELCGVERVVSSWQDPDRPIESEQDFHLETYRILSAMQITLVDALMGEDWAE